ncbi:MAG: DNA adenine methylase, partial [Sulfurimonadaceae bacterium]|nr:DNA adenine methylase [Sulfurimonadaceae bacterium]
MNYIGSKLKLSSWIEEEVKKVAGDDLSEKIFCDIFAGTGIVG